MNVRYLNCMSYVEISLLYRFENGKLNYFIDNSVDEHKSFSSVLHTHID